MLAPDLERLDEEFSNFMFKVNQVNNIVQKLASNDKNLQEIGNLEAKEYLGETKEKDFTNLDENSVKFIVKNDRTVINKKALMKEDNPATQSQETFMAEVSKDAERRYKDKLMRKERMETLKKQATLAFRRGDYEKALSLYTKAIEQIRDSCMLYTNRALTYLNLKFYEKAEDDCNTALKLNENSLKARLLLAKCHYLRHEKEKFASTVAEAKERHSEHIDLIHDFIHNLQLKN